MTGFRTMLRKELLEEWRTGRLVILGVVFLASGITSPLLARYTPELLQKMSTGSLHVIAGTPTTKDAIDQVVGNLGGLIGSMTVILMTMGALAGEMGGGTAALILSKPATRPAFLSAKALGLSTSVAVAVVLGAIAAYGYTAVLFETISPLRFLGGSLCLLVGLLVYMTVGFLGGALTGSRAGAASAAIGYFFTSSVLGVLPVVRQLTPAGLDKAATDVFLGATSTGLVVPLAANVVVIAITFAMAVWAFRRWEYEA